MIMEKEYWYIYTLVREDFKTGSRGKRTKKIYRFAPDLDIGGLYCHLGVGYPGCQRVISMDIQEV